MSTEISPIIIIPPYSSQSEQWYVCEDHLDMGLVVEWSDWSENARPTLQKARDAKRSRSLDKAGTSLQIAGIWLEMSNRGKAVGGDSGVYYAYVLSSKELGIEFMIMDAPGGSPSLPNVRAKLDGKYFLQEGDGRFGYGTIRSVIKELGGTISDSALTRVDLAIDMPGVGIDLFRDALDQGSYVTKARSTPVYTSDCKTVYFGRKTSKIRCRIYDKLCEIGDKMPVLLTMERRRWGGIIPDSAVRIEYQLRRAALKRLGIDSVEDLFKKEADVLNYLTTDWLRFTDGPVDRGNHNQKRARTLPLWQAISERFVTGVGGLTGKPLAPVPPVPINVEHRAKAIVGSVLSVAMGTGTPLPDIKAFNAYALELMEPYAQERLPLVCRK